MATNNINILSEMHDIAELDKIGCWPLAIGWWLLIGILGALIIVVIVFAVKYNKYKKSWYYFMYLELTALEQTITTKPRKYIITELSEDLRKIAIKKYPREACASLVGNNWLAWLNKYDPKRFNWIKNGKILISEPYAPVMQSSTNNDLQMLIKAAKMWVKFL